MEYPQYPNGVFGDAVPRAVMLRAAASRAGRCDKGGGPNDYIYVIIQPPGWEPLMKLCGRPDLITDAEWATPEKRLPKLDKVFRDHRAVGDDSRQAGSHARTQQI
jgi:formyl-CoA transferase